jgi:predicted transcriptional regulator
MKNFVQKPKATEPRSLRSAPVTQYMATQLITFTPETAIDTVINTLLDRGITGAPVLNDQKEVVGLIDDKDCLNVLVHDAYHNQPGPPQHTVSAYMSNVMRTISDSKGKCPTCGVVMFKILGGKAASVAPAPAPEPTTPAA